MNVIPDTEQIEMNIKPGMRVYWHDPDQGICSRVLNIKTAEKLGYGWLIEDDQGDVIEAMERELEIIE